MFVANWGDVFTQSLYGIWDGVAGFVPVLVIAIVVLAIGWVLAMLVEKLVETIFKSLKIDAALKAAGVDSVVERAGYKLNSGAFVGSLVKWFVIVVFLVASFDVLHLTQVNAFLKDVVLSYLPNVIVAVLVLMIGVVIGDVVQKLVIASARAAHVKSAALLGKIAKWAIWIVALLTALVRLGLDSGPLNTIFIGLVAALALAAGLSFGLGCRDHAGKLVEKLVRDVSEKE